MGYTNKKTSLWWLVCRSACCCFFFFIGVTKIIMLFVEVGQVYYLSTRGTMLVVLCWLVCVRLFFFLCWSLLNHRWSFVNLQRCARVNMKLKIQSFHHRFTAVFFLPHWAYGFMGSAVDSEGLITFACENGFLENWAKARINNRIQTGMYYWALGELEESFWCANLIMAAWSQRQNQWHESKSLSLHLGNVLFCLWGDGGCSQHWWAHFKGVRCRGCSRRGAAVSCHHLFLSLS